MKARRVAALLALVPPTFLFATPATATEPIGEPLGGPAEMHPWPQGSGVFGRTLAADLGGDAILDLVTSQGGTLFAVFGPADHYGVYALHSAPNDFDVLPGGLGAADRVVVADATEIVTLDVVDGAIAMGETIGLANAGLVRVGDFDGDDDYDVAALRPDGMTIDIYEDQGGQFLYFGSITAAGLVLDMTAVHWNDPSDGKEELAVNSTAGLTVYDPLLGSGLYTRTVLRTDDALARLVGAGKPVAGPPGDALAWITGLPVGFPPGNDQVLLVIDEAQAVATLVPEGLHVTGAVGADAVPDAYDRTDLVLAAEATGNVHVLENDGVKFEFLVDLGVPEDSRWFTHELDPGAPQGGAWMPAVADFDLDGVVDFIAPLTGQVDELAIVRGPLDEPPALPGTSDWMGCFSFNWNEPDELVLTLDYNGLLLPNATHFQVIVWYAPAGGDTELDAIQNEIVQGPLVTGTGFRLTFPRDDLDPALGEHELYFEIRSVHWNGNVRWAGSSQILGFYTDESKATRDDCYPLPYDGPRPCALDNCYLGGWTGQFGTAVGGLKAGALIPAYPVGEIANAGPPVPH